MLGHRPLVPEDYLAILKRRWWLILLPLCVLPILAYAFSYTISPRYLSQSLVLIEGQKVPDDYVKPVVATDLDSRLASMKEQILSRSHLQPIIERYNLYGTQKLDMDDRIDLVRKDIEVKPIHSEIAHSGGLPGFFITFKGDDAHTVQLVCSDITTLFVNENLRLREQSAEGTTDFLKSQLDDAKRSLDDQDAKLAAFERQNMGKLPGEANENTGMLSTLNSQLDAVTQQITQAEQNRSYVQAMLAQQGQPLTPSGSTAPVSTSVPNPAYQEKQTELQTLQSQEADLETHYTPDYPDVIAMKRKIADLRAQIASTPKTLTSAAAAAANPGAVHESSGVLQLRAQLRAMDIGLDAKRKQQAELQSEMRSYQDKIASSPAIEEEYKQVTRDYQTAQAFYDDLLKKMNESKMATDLEKRQEGEQFQLMDPANLPDAPFSPKRSMFLISGAAFGLMLGLALAGLLEFRDTSLRGDRDIWAFTNLPTLGMIGFSAVTEHEAEGKGGARRWFRFRRPRQIAGAQG